MAKMALIRAARAHEAAEQAALASRVCRDLSVAAKSRLDALV
jgi:hypothetical protein